MEKPEKLIKKYNLEDKFIFLTVARLDERKGHDSVIKAMATLKNRYSHLIYIITGKGREEEKLKKLTEEYDLLNRVIFTGYIPDEELVDYYNLCDVFILPNRETKLSSLKGDYEGFGIVFLEASACGKAIIAGKSGGVGDAVKDKETGLLIDPYSVGELIEAMELLINNKEMRKKLGENGRRRVENLFSLEKLRKDLSFFI